MTTPPTTAKRLVFAFILCSLVALATEGAARLGMSALRAHDGLTVNSSVWWKELWLKRHTSEREIWFSFDQFDATKGWVSKSNVRNLKVFRGKSLNTNSRGMRGTREFAAQPPPGVTRVAVVGASYTFGDEVSDDETYTHQAQLLLPDFEFMNLGVHGYGNDQMLGMLQDVALPLLPRIVVVGFLYSDMERNLLAFRDYAKPWYQLEGDRVVLRGVPLPSPKELLAKAWRSRGLVDLVDECLWRFDAATGRATARKRALTEGILVAIKDQVEAAKAIPLFYFLPTIPDLKPPRETFFDDFCKKHSARCLSAETRFAEALAAGVDLGVDHWPPAGHALAGKILAEYLSTNLRNAL